MLVGMIMASLSAVSGCDRHPVSSFEKENDDAAADSAASTKLNTEQARFGERFEFGIVRAGDVVQHNFLLTNTWNRPTRINDIQSFCDCTAIGPPDVPVAPGASILIPAVLQTKGKAGPVRVGFVCQLDNGATIDYRFEGFVSSAELKRISFGRTQRGSEKRYQATLPMSVDCPFTVTAESVFGHAIDACLAESSVDRHVYDVTVTADAPSGAFADTITFETTDRFNPIKTVVVDGYIEYPLEIDPTELGLGVVDEEASAQVTARVYSPYGKTITLDAIEQVGGATMRWTVNNVSNSEMEISVQAEPRDSDDPVYSAEIRIRARVDEELFQRSIRVYGLNSHALNSN
jgi:hypothetical protein